MLTFLWLSFAELICYSLLAVVPFVVVLVALYAYNLGAPKWVVRKTIHIFGNSLFAAYLVLTSNILVILYIGLLVILELLLIGLVFRRFITFMLSITTRTGEDSNELRWNIILSLTTVIVLYVFLSTQPTDYSAVFLVSVFAFSIGDGMGEFVGRPFGNHMYRSSQKSVEGSFAVFSGTFVSAVVIFYLYSILSLHVVGILFIASIVATVVEALSKKYYDNILIPISVAMTLLLLL